MNEIIFNNQTCLSIYFSFQDLYENAMPEPASQGKQKKKSVGLVGLAAYRGYKKEAT